MGKVFLKQFKEKLAKRHKSISELGKPSIKIEFDDFVNQRNQTFISYLSKYLTNSNVRKKLVKNYGQQYCRPTNSGGHLFSTKNKKRPEKKNKKRQTKTKSIKT